MFINKIGSVTNPNFQGYQYAKNNVGDTVMRFNFPYDYENETCAIEFYKVSSQGNNSYKLLENPIAKMDLKEGGIDVNVQDIALLGKNEPFAYRYVKTNKKSGEVTYIADSGIKINNRDAGKNIRLDKNENISSPEYSLVLRNGTTPMVQGAGYLGFPDSQRPGVSYKNFDDANTGEIYIDKNVQKEMENTIRTFSNKFGGNIAGMEYNIDYLKKNGYKIQYTNPLAGGDDKSSHHYWNKNNMQISDDMGNIENFASYTRKLFQNGIKYVYDGTFTSEGLEGIHFQYALRWADKKPQSYYWFRMSGLKDASLGLGAVPENKANLRHRVINPPVIYNSAKNRYEENKNYDANKETFFQIYDASQVTDAQLSKLDKPIENYKNLKSGNPLAINDHNDTIINYVCEINPKEYINRLDAFIDYNKKNNKPIELNSPDGTILISQFSNFKIDKKTEGGFVTWDANTDMVKMNYHISAYDEKLNQAIVSPSQRELEKQLQVRGSYEVQDMAVQAGKYWTGKFKDIQSIYAAQTLKGITRYEDVQKLIEHGLLPKEAEMSAEALSNILNGYYNLEPKGILDKDQVTVKALMKLPLDSLEFAENTVGVLSTSYFSNRATSEDQIGMTRFELMQKKNPHLVEEYAKNYLRVNDMFSNEIKNFAHEIIKKVNEKSTEKLLDKDGNYTEYGEYVIELMGADIAKYAFLKSLTKDKLKTKILPNGEITYDYKNIKENTTLKSLGIKAVSPQDEANKLQKLMERGLKALDTNDVNYIVKSISKRIEGTNTNSFRIAEAMIDKASLGLDWRLDAAKDVMDQDAVRNGDTSFDETWQNVIDFWKKFVTAVKSENPNSYIVAEITDMEEIMQGSLGDNVGCYNIPEIGRKFKNVPDAMIKFLNETGITSEAAYSYFFTDLIKTFSAEFETGSMNLGNSRFYEFVNKVEELISTRGIDYTRNLFTFVGNHDKPRIIHGMALDMGLFHGSLEVSNNDFGINRNRRIDSMLQLTNSDKIEDLPLEARLNIDNPSYFMTVSTKAVAMSKLLRSAINETMYGVATAEEIKYLKAALVDLTNGNHLGIGENTKIHSINIPALTSAENALRALLTMSGINLTSDEIQAVLAKANEQAMLDKYMVQGGFEFAGDNTEIVNANRSKLETILRGEYTDIPSGDVNYNKYDLYTVNVAGLLREAFLSVKGDDAYAKRAFLNATRDFVRKYDSSTVNANRTKLPFVEPNSRAITKNAYAARDLKTAVQMLISQAEYIARKDGRLGKDEHFANRDRIHLDVYKNAAEPATQKAIMMMAFLSALVGIPTIYGGDELGMSGYEEKAKNVYLQNRNALPWSELEEGIFKEYRNKVLREMNAAMGIRSRDGVDALNFGTPYKLSTSNQDVPAFLMQDGYGNMTISVFNATGINPHSRFDYFKENGITDKNRERFFKDNNLETINPNNKYVPIQKNVDLDYIALAAGISLPIGLTFMNSDSRDKSIYEVQKDYKVKIKNEEKIIPYALIRKGGKISLNGLTAKNGAMILKRIAFRGKNLSKQYNIVSNPYKQNDTNTIGEKLSLISG